MIDLYLLAKVDNDPCCRRIDLDADHHDDRCDNTRQDKYQDHAGQYPAEPSCIGHTGYCRCYGKEDEGHDGREQKIKEYVSQRLKYYGILPENKADDGAEHN